MGLKVMREKEPHCVDGLAGSECGEGSGLRVEMKVIAELTPGFKTLGPEPGVRYQGIDLPYSHRDFKAHLEEAPRWDPQAFQQI